MTERALTTSEGGALTTAQILSGLNTVRGVLAPDLSDEELRLFAMVANRSGLDPFARQVFAIKRKDRVTFQTGIDGYRSIAARTGLFDGQDEPEYGPMADKPYVHPEWATVRVYRKGVGRAIAATAYWDEYVPADGQDHMWRKMPRVMLAKVAEALALRKAFPYDPENRQGIGADVYTADEMAQADRPAAQAPAPTVRDRVAARRAAVTPAEDVEEAEEAEYREVPPEPVPAPSTGPCGDPSPYGDGSACSKDANHAGHHANAERESWERKA
jgi:phage recombination protein Bet